MNEGAPKIPANENMPPVESAEGNTESLEKLARGSELYQALAMYDEKIITAEENQVRKQLNEELNQIMMDTSLSWKELTDAGLPWDPYLETVRQKAANDNRSPAESEFAKAS